MARMSAEHVRCLAAALQRERPDLQMLSEDGKRIASHRSLAALASPLLAKILAEHDLAERVTTIYVPARSKAVLAFKR